jgi:hypothetical protein
MIRKSGNRFSLATNAKRVCAEIMLKQRDLKGGHLHPLRSYVPSAVSVSQCVLGVSAIMTTTMMMKSRAKIHLTLSPLVTHASD